MARQSIKTLVNMDDATARREISRAVSTLAGGWWEFDVKPRKSTRSLAQNAWYWSCIAGALAKYMSAQDYEITTADDAHEFLKDRFLRVDVVNPKTELATVPTHFFQVERTGRSLMSRCFFASPDRKVRRLTKCRAEAKVKDGPQRRQAKTD